MSVAAQVLYKADYVAAFERTKSILVPTVRHDVQDMGGSLVFLVAGSGGRTTVTRGSNGLIPPADDSQTQVTLTLAEAHDLRELTNFDIFKAQGDQMKLMREESLGVIHRKQDAVIIAAAATGTVDLGAIGTMNKQVANKIVTILGNADAGSDGRNAIHALISNAAFAYMEDITSFGSSDYSKTGGNMDDGLPEFGIWKYWMGINWAAHNGLVGVGTSAAKCLAWNRNAIGYAMSTRGVDAQVGYDLKQDTSWRRASVFHGAVKLQNSGIVKFDHDDTALSS